MTTRAPSVLKSKPLHKSCLWSNCFLLLESTVHTILISGPLILYKMYLNIEKVLCDPLSVTKSVCHVFVYSRPAPSPWSVGTPPTRKITRDANQDVENTPKCTCLNCILAPQSHLLGLAFLGFDLVQQKLPKAPWSQGLSSAYNSNFFRSHHKF